MTIPAPFRVTPEDLEGMDSKVKQALLSLTEPLNVTLNDVVSILTGGVGADNLSEDIKQVTLAVDASPGDAFPLVFRTTVKQPRMVLLAQCTPKDPAHTLVDPFVMQGWSVTDRGLISVPWITNLLAANSYSLTFWVR